MQTIDTLVTKKDNALSAYKNGSQSDRALLISLFGDRFFKPVTERINNFEDACQELGIDPLKERPYESPKSPHQEALNAIAEIFIIIEAANEGQKPDWTNPDQYKYEPIFKMNDTELSFVDVDDWRRFSGVGSRLCFLNSNHAEHFARKFIKTYEKFMFL